MTEFWIHLCNEWNFPQRLSTGIKRSFMENFLCCAVSDCSWNVLPLCVDVICTLLSIVNCTVYPLFSSLNFVEVCKLLVSQLEESSIFFRFSFSETLLVMSIGDWLFPSHFLSTIPQCIGPEKWVRNYTSKTKFYEFTCVTFKMGSCEILRLNLPDKGSQQRLDKFSIFYSKRSKRTCTAQKCGFH